MRLVILLSLACFLGFTAIGCGGGIKTNYVEGIVTLDGEPLSGASVTFIPVAEDGLTAGGFSDDWGVYRLSSVNGSGGRGALAGEYVVTVAKTKEVPLARPVKHDDGTETKTTSESVLAPIYRERTKTPLKFTVKNGSNKIDLPLKSKP